MTNLAVNLAATGHGDRPAVRLDDHVLSHAELDAAARAVAGDLRAGLMPLPMLAPFPDSATPQKCRSLALRWRQADTGAW